MSVSDLVHSPGRSIVLVNPPVAVVDHVQLDFYADAFPFGLYQIREWLRRLGHHAQLADMMSYGKHQRDWSALVESGELTPIGSMPGGAAGTHLPVWRYGKGLEWLHRWLDDREAPDEFWVSCSILFNAFLAHEVIAGLKTRFPRATVRFGGGYPTLLPEDARQSGADEIVEGRVYEADGIQPELDGIPDNLHFVPFRLTTGCPNRCAFCINGRDRMIRHNIEAVVEFIRKTRETRGIRHFNNWDPNVLRFKPHLKQFLRELARQKLDVRLRFDMGFEPPLLDDELLDLLEPAGVEAFSLPFETSDPSFARLFNKPYTIVSSIRAADRIRKSGVQLSECHGTYVIGCPDEQPLDLFTTYHAMHQFDLHSTPFPMVVIPGSPIHDRYGHLLEGRAYPHYNGHLFPLIQDRDQANRYRRLLSLLSTNDPTQARRKSQALDESTRDAFEASRLRAERLIEAVLASRAPDSLELLTALHGQIG